LGTSGAFNAGIESAGFSTPQRADFQTDPLGLFRGLGHRLGVWIFDGFMIGACLAPGAELR